MTDRIAEIEAAQRLQQTFNITDVGGELDRRWEAIDFLLEELKSKSAECERLRGLLREMKQRAYFSTGNGYETIEDTLQNIDADPADYSPEVIDLQSRVLAELEDCQ